MLRPYVKSQTGMPLTVRVLFSQRGLEVEDHVAHRQWMNRRVSSLSQSPRIFVVRGSKTISVPELDL